MTHKLQTPSSAPSQGGYLSPDGDTSSAASAPAQEAAPQGEPGKVFTQDEVNRIAQERQQRAERSVLSKLGVSNLTEAEQAIKRARELEAQAEAARLKKLEDDGKLTELLEETRAKKDAEIAARDAELARIKAEVQREKMTLTLERLCARAVKPSQAALLLQASGALRFDEAGRLYVDDGSGKQKLDAKGNPLSVDDFVGSWFRENPHLERAQGAQSQVIKPGQQGSSAQMIPGEAQGFDESRRHDLEYLRSHGQQARAWLRRKK